MARKPTNQQAMAWFFQQDIWQQRLIAREATLKMYDELARDRPQHADRFREAKRVQRQAIQACRTQDQQLWDQCEAQHHTIMAQIREAA